MLIISNQQCTNCLAFLLRINKKWSLKHCLFKRVTSKIIQLFHCVTLYLTEGIVNNHQNNSFQLSIPSKFQRSKTMPVHCNNNTMIYIDSNC